MFSFVCIFLVALDSFFCFTVRFFARSCVYLECSLLVLGSEYSTEFYSFLDNEIDAMRSHGEIDSIVEAYFPPPRYPSPLTRTKPKILRIM